MAELEPPLSPRDDVANDVRAAIQSLKADNPEPDVAVEEHPEPIAAEPVQNTAAVDPTGEGRVRNPDGTYAKAAKDAPKQSKTKSVEAPVEAAPAPIPSKDTQAKESPTASPPAVAPPAGWTAAEKAEWSKLPPAIQTAVSRREQEITNGGQQWSAEKRQLQGVLSPIAQLAQSKGIPLDQATQALASAQAALDRDPAQAIAWLAQSYGVDLTTLASNPPVQAPRIDPMVAQLGNSVSQIQNTLQGFLQSQTMGVVESFAKDHPHFDEVAGELERIIPIVQQQNPGLPHQEVLSKAYDQAIWLNQTVRDRMIAEKTQPAQLANAVAAKAKKSAAAAVSIKGASNGVAVQPKAYESTGDVYDDVRAAIHQLRN